MLTIFSCPKPFTRRINIIQRNAIKSWQLLSPKPEIILSGDELGTKEICQELSIEYIPEIERNEYGTPLVNSIFSKAEERASYDILCYINADIVLTDDFIKTVELVKKWKTKFLIVGRRYDVEINQEFNFNEFNCIEMIKLHTKQNGILHSSTGIDYFIFVKGVFPDILPFAIGRTAWDCWLVYQARHCGIPVVDATNKIWAIHQNHGYKIDAHRDGDWNWDEKEIKLNLELSHGLFRDISNATHRIKNNRIYKRNIYLFAEPSIFFLKKLLKKIKAYFKK